MKIISIVGARPQFIKAAMLSHEFMKSDLITEKIIHTGQHYDSNMSDIFFSELNIPSPHYNLDIHEPTHGAATALMLSGIEKHLINEKADIVVTYGDTNSTLAGALAAAKLNIPVAHVESGLRSFNRSMPEEINRVVTDHVSDYLFAPTQTAVHNLKKENRPENGIFFSGDIMFDATLKAIDRTDEKGILREYELSENSYSLATLHRAENTDDPTRLEIWFNALNIASGQETIVFPLHPRTKKRLEEADLPLNKFKHIQFIPPVGYGTMAALIKNARLIITDSGGLQKEAYFHRKPGLILRTETEWVELIETDWSQLIECNIEHFLESFENFRPPLQWKEDLFGNGDTARIITDILSKV